MCFFSSIFSVIIQTISYTIRNNYFLRHEMVSVKNKSAFVNYNCLNSLISNKEEINLLFYIK